ncbi:hypothetical protein OH76DRAFT_1192256 [Lentinus brumalis]|uniref:Uncharacterized protein n=1 Tax=Lentinus brumalis TaxID=2498619 RepID=A0A371CTI9_9APHY|nr:hypothetical protein OH76DRAFT_1192256 [Polyporus brumalis]
MANGKVGERHVQCLTCIPAALLPCSSLHPAHGCLSASPPREWLPWSESANSDIPCETLASGDRRGTVNVCRQQASKEAPVNQRRSLPANCPAPPSVRWRKNSTILLPSASTLPAVARGRTEAGRLLQGSSAR